MRKAITLFLIMFSGNPLNAQNKICTGIQPLPIHSAQKNIAIPVKSISEEPESIPLNVIERNENSGNNPASVSAVIGSTLYGLQSNGSMGNRIYKSGNKIGVVWVHSLNAPTYIDRGTGYNFSNDNGVSWQPAPTVRLESDRRNFPSIDYLASGGEVVVSHSTNTDLKILERTTAGSGTWSQNFIPGTTVFTLWPRMKTGGQNGNTIHVIDITPPIANGGSLYNGLDGCLTYSKSDNGGLTWSIVHQVLPDIDTIRYHGIGAESYAIDSKDSVVAICQSWMTSDWALWKSTDNGNTWTHTIIDSFPIPAYNAMSMTMTTDTNSDGIADTINTVDGTVSVLIDNAGTVHCWAAKTKVIQDTLMQMGYFPASDGIMYWNENFGTAPPVMIASTPDLDGDSIINANGFGMYANMSMSKMPCAGIDTSGNIFLTYVAPVENNYLSGGACNNNVFCVASPDNGISWSSPFNISSSADREEAYSCIAREVDDKVHIVWQNDSIPGFFNAYKNIVYKNVSTSLILNGLSASTVTVSGNIFFDANANKIKDAGEINLEGQKVLLMPDSVYAYTDTSGDFKFYVYSGNYTVQYFPYNNWQVTTDSLSYTITVSGFSLTGFDFGSNFINSQSHVAGYLSAAHPRCSQIIPLVQHYQNTGTNFLDGEIRMIIDTAVSYVSSTPLPAVISGDTIWWNYVNLTPFERRDINVLIQIPGPAYSGTFIQTSSVVSYDSSSVLIPSDYDTVTQTILCSFDPNDKNVSPQGIGLNHLTLMNTTLEYTIRFQNTGTDTAYKVTIFDTLDSSLDVNTFEFTSSSHAVQVLLNANGILKFIFNTIHLPDSNINEPGSHGFVSFRILAKAGLPDWTTVNNKATIFFDFHDGVTTNTVFNTLVYALTGVDETPFSDYKIIFYPNPFSDYALLKYPNPDGDSFVFSIFDAAGRGMLTEASNQPVIRIGKGTLNKGIYFYSLMNKDKVKFFNGKFVIN